MLNFAKYLKDSLQHKNIGPDGKKKKRSSKWRKVRNKYLKEHPKCAVCESTSKVEVHHIVMFSIDPSLELEPKNLITLCENKKYGVNCHLLIGHCGSYRKFNPGVEIDATTWNMKLKGER